MICWAIERDFWKLCIQFWKIARLRYSHDVSKTVALFESQRNPIVPATCVSRVTLTWKLNEGADFRRAPVVSTESAPEVTSHESTYFYMRIFFTYWLLLTLLLQKDLFLQNSSKLEKSFQIKKLTKFFDSEWNKFFD